MHVGFVSVPQVVFNGFGTGSPFVPAILCHRRYVMHVGQGHLLCLQHLSAATSNHGLSDILYLSVQKNDIVSVPKRRAEKGSHMCMNAAQLTGISPSHDDLRSGAFVYLHSGTVHNEHI